MATRSPSTTISASPFTAPSETMSEASARSSFITGRMLWPPASSLASGRFLSSATASATVAGRWNSKSFMSRSLRAGGLDRTPHLLGRGWHRDVGDPERRQRVEDRVDHRRRHADRPDLADALHAERVVGARGGVV